MRIAFDTNVLVYAEGGNDPRRQQQAKAALKAVGHCELVLPVQAAAEFHGYLTRRMKQSRIEAGEVLRRWREVFRTLAPTSADAFDEAVTLATTHRFQIFDAIILAAVADADCRMLLSEDMQDGFVWRGVTVVSPFAETPHPLFADLLRTA